MLHDADEEAAEEEAPRGELVIESLGGEAEGRRLIVSGGPSWRPGDEVLVALHGASGLASPVVGFAQGLWRVTGDGLVDGGGRFLGLDPAGALVRADGPTATPSVLDAVRAALAGDAPPPAAPEDEAPQDVPPADEPPAEGDGVPAPDEEEAGEGRSAEPPGTPAGDGEAPSTPTRPVGASYRVDDAGGPLLLSDRVARAAAAWEALAPELIDLTRSEDATHAFEYGDEALFSPGLLTLTLAEAGEVRVLVRPEEHPALDAALRHEVGSLLGLSPATTGVMAMAVADPAAAPGAVELAELAALTAFEPADLDRDGAVGFGDLLELAAAYGRTGVNLAGDLDGDGDVDDEDVALLRRSYAFAPPAGAAPPGQDAPAEEPDEPPAPEQPQTPEEPNQEPDEEPDDEPEQEPDEEPEGAP